MELVSSFPQTAICRCSVLAKLGRVKGEHDSSSTFLQRLTSPSPASTNVRLGDECNRDRDCEISIADSHCYLGYCRCQPFFAGYNGTHCLECESILLLNILNAYL